jgi:hypothetical protein
MLDFILALTGFGLLFHVQASFWESLFHEHVLDLTPERRVRFHTLRGIWPRLWATHFDHGVLHHYRTFRQSYVEMFHDADEEARLQSQPTTLRVVAPGQSGGGAGLVSQPSISVPVSAR